MLEDLGFEGWSARAASVVFGILLGAAFGVLAQRSRFCLRRALVAGGGEAHSAGSLWATALAVAVLGTTGLVASGLVSFAEHRYHATSIPVGAVLLGGLLFGAGMVFTRGCASRLTVLAGTGNLRAVVAILVFAATVYATMKGALAPLRVWLSSAAVDLPIPATLAALPGGLWLATVVIGLATLAYVIWAGARLRQIAFGSAIGALVPLGWWITSVLLADEFEPIAQETLAFTSSASQTLFWWMAGTAIAPDFSVGLFAGTLLGSFIAALVAREFAVVGFTKETPTGRYLLGGVMMGVGGVLAGGCTIGAGLGGVSSLSLSAMLALASIVAGALLTHRLDRTRPVTEIRSGEKNPNAGFALAHSEP